MQKEDIHSLNLHSLLVLRDCAKENQATACYRFGCDPDLANDICGMSMEKLGALAQSDCLLFTLKYKSTDLNVIKNIDPQLRSLFLEGFNRAAR